MTPAVSQMPGAAMGGQKEPGARGVRLVRASAGSGKTYRLTQEVTGAVNPALSAPIPVEALVAVTYTTKAQTELETRIRRVLVENAAFERAQELPLAYVGTVHSVCLRLVKEFALDAGLSPTVDVIPGNEGRRLLQAALERELDFETQSRLRELATRFDFEFLPQLRRNDWVLPVDEIMTLARGNRIDPADLPVMARRSIEGLMALLPPSAISGRVLEAELSLALEGAIARLSRLDDDTKVTREALGELRAAATNLRLGRLAWPEWAKLARVAPAKRAASFVLPVHEAASAYDTHPRFRCELRELVEKLFEAARVGLLAYADWKAQRGLVDYVDMIARALDVLAVPGVEQELRERLRLVVVDEFQDTSPIQLALFARLHAICGRSVWVGDRKQCIFEYAGADPALMEAAARWVDENGGDTEVLNVNHRSRPELVEAAALLFSAGFARHGHAEHEVATTATRRLSLELEELAPLGVWWLRGKEAPALASGVARLLADPASTPVLDRASGAVRPVRPSDVAVLVHSNAEAARVAAELAARGIASVLPRVGLLTTPEGTFIVAALRFLVDRWDTLAVAELDALTCFERFATPAAEETGNARVQAADRWLTAKVRDHRLRVTAQAASGTDQETPTADELPNAALELERLRERLTLLSPAEVLDEVLSVLDVARLAVGWPEPEQRLANLDALRALAAAYEERCSYQRETASLPGLLRYFEETQQKIRQRDEERATDEQHVGRDDAAVVISTYHKAKGLEWPVVILASLGRDRKRDAFEVTPESDRDHFDAADPLAGRWIRFWPWPLGLGGKTDAPLALRAASSPEGKAVAEREARERTRLLYVGFTRARDHLILAVHCLKKGPSTAWLDELHDDRGPLIALPDPNPRDCGDTHLKVTLRGLAGRRLEVPARTWSFEASEPEPVVTEQTEPRRWFAPSTPASTDVPSYWIAPSAAADAALDLPAARVVSSTRFTRRMPFATPKGMTFDQVGNALHAFLGADRAELEANARRQLADRVLARAGLDAFVTSDVVIAASDALRNFVAERWPNAVWHREVPITAMLDSAQGRRRIAGSIDLLLETAGGYVIIDHKSFPGRASEWHERALGYAPQLFTYARAIEMAHGKVAGMFIHFLIGGGIVEIGEARA